MYKCRECGCEYTEKPDFCDCGNDEFEEILTEQKEALSSKTTEELGKESKISHNVEDKNEDNYSEINKFRESVSPISLSIFLVCIVLSFIVIFFLWNPKDDLANENEKNEVKLVQNIPSIEQFWNEAAPKPVEEEKKKEEVKPQAIVVKISTPKVKSKKVDMTPQKSKQVQTNTKTTVVKLTKTQPVVQQKSNDKNAETKAKLEAEQKARIEAQAKAKQEAENKAKQSELANREFLQYKTNLRNTLGQKIDFTKVVGDGNCTVSFKLDSTGKLINRSFAKQSTNITLNDAVYNAIMATPKFNPPPSAYANETLNLYIKFYNGNFEITLK